MCKLFKMKSSRLAYLFILVWSFVFFATNEVSAEAFLFLDNGTRIMIPDILDNLKIVEPNRESDCLKNRNNGDANLDLWLICNRQTFASDIDLYNQRVSLSEDRYAQERELTFFDVGELHEQNTPEAIEEHISNMLPATDTFHFERDSNDAFLGCTGIMDNGDAISMYLVIRISNSLVEGYFSIEGGHYTRDDEMKYEGIMSDWLARFRSANQ